MGREECSTSYIDRWKQSLQHRAVVIAICHMPQTVMETIHSFETLLDSMRLNRRGPLVHETCCKDAKRHLNLLGRDNKQHETLCLSRLRRWASAS
jgi:hypothetical protein